MRFTGMQREISSKLRETRQEAMSQRRPITFRYDHNNKRIIIYGGAFGAAGAGTNRVTELSQGGLTPDEIGYGRPTGIPPNALSDGTNLTPLDVGNIVEVAFQADGAVTDASGNLQNKALFFYNRITPAPTAFALSILGAGGRVKVWRYNAGASAYIE
jgi:Tfp pilus assembly protein FimT